MNAFKAGDIVQIVATQHAGSVTSVKVQCTCFDAVILATWRRESIYQLTGFDGFCFPESVLKRLGGERPATGVKTDEVIDEPAEV